MIAALEFEALKARRAPVFRAGGLLVIFGVPGLTAAFYVLARAGGTSASAVKAAAMITDYSLAGFVSQAGQILSVGTLLSVGIVAAWSFGREFVDGTAPALFAVAASRGQIALAKIVVLLAWAVATVAATTALTLGAGSLLGLGPLDPNSLRAAGRMLAGGLLVAALTLPFALVASWRRGYLPGVVALLLVVVVTQVATVLGLGGWFPYAAPSLWLGMGGPEAAREISVAQLLLPLVVGAAAGWACVQWWRRAEIAS